MLGSPSRSAPASSLHCDMLGNAVLDSKCTLEERSQNRLLRLVVMVDGWSSKSCHDCRFCRSSCCNFRWHCCRRRCYCRIPCSAGGLESHHSHLLVGCCVDAIFPVPRTPDWSLMPRRPGKRTPDHNHKPQTLRSQTPAGRAQATEWLLFSSRNSNPEMFCLFRRACFMLVHRLPIVPQRAEEGIAAWPNAETANPTLQTYLQASAFQLPGKQP